MEKGRAYKIVGIASFIKVAALFKGPPAGAAARRFLAIFQKIGFSEKLVKIWFWSRFGLVWAVKPEFFMCSFGLPSARAIWLDRTPFHDHFSIL